MNETPQFVDLTMDELAVHHAQLSTLGMQEERIRRAMQANNFTVARSALQLVEGWTATTEDDMQRLETIVYGEFAKPSEDPVTPQAAE